MTKAITTLYFSHDYNTRNNNKIQDLIFKHGFLGYGLFWALVEELYNNSNSLPINYNRFAFSFHVDVQIIISVINDFDLFVIKNEKFSSKSVGERLKKREKVSEDAKNSAKKKWDNYRNGKGLQCDATAERPHSDGNATAMPMQSDGNAINKRKEIKEKEIKESKEKEKDLNEFFESLPDANWSNLLKSWLEYKKERKENYKSVSSIKVFCRNLIGLSNGEYLLAEQIINQSIGNNWAGIFALKNNNQNGKSINTAEAEQAEFRRVAEMLRRTVSNNSRPS